MKRIFKFALVALAAAAVAVACQKPAEEQKQEDKPGPGPDTPEEVVPVEGTSDWSVIGALLETNWDKDFVMAASGDNFVLKNVKLAAANEFKIRFQKDWGVNRGGDFAELGKGFAVTNNGNNVKPALDGVYDIWYNPAVEQMAVVAKDGAPAWGELIPPTPEEYVHDYTPGAEYLAEGNLWKAVDAAGAGFFTVNKVPGADPEWPRSGEATAEGLYAFAHQQSTYSMHYALESAGDWERQLFLFPKDEDAVAIVKDGVYNFKMSVYANKNLPRVFFKVVNNQADKDNKEGGSVIFGDEIKPVTAGQATVFEYTDVVASVDAENITFVIDFGGAPADVDIFVKDITIVKTGGAEPEPEKDFTSPDWSTVPAVAEGNHTFKFTKDAEYAYFYTARERDSRFDELWGAGKGYVYFAFDVDGDPTNGESLNSNGPYDYIAFIYCFSGDKDNPEISINNAGDVRPSTYSLGNVIAKGTVDANGLVLEYRVPLADLPQLPESFTITTWGNKDLKKVVYNYPVEEEAGLSVSEILALENNTEVTTKSSLVMAKCTRGVILTDGTEFIYAYNSAGVAAEVGDMVVLSGTKKVYNGVPEIDGAKDVDVKSSGNTVKYPAAKDITATVTEYTAEKAEFISLVGTLSKSGNYYNMAIEGTDAKVGSIAYPVEALNVDSFDGKKIKATGFFNGLSGGGKYVNIITVKIEEITEGGIVLDGKFDDWADIDAIANEKGNALKEFKTASDADNLYFYVKIAKSDIKAVKEGKQDPTTGLYPFEGRRYLYMAFDTDNDSTTGPEVPGSGDMTIPGAEILSIVYPFRGYSTVAEGTDGSEVVNGVDSNSYVKVLGTSTKTGEKLSAYGVIDEEYGYIEIAMPRAGAELAAGTYKMQFSLSSSLSQVFEMEVK